MDMETKKRKTATKDEVFETTASSTRRRLLNIAYPEISGASTILNADGVALFEDERVRASLDKVINSFEHELRRGGFSLCIVGTLVKCGIHLPGHESLYASLIGALNAKANHVIGEVAARECLAAASTLFRMLASKSSEEYQVVDFGAFADAVSSSGGGYLKGSSGGGDDMHDDGGGGGGDGGDDDDDEAAASRRALAAAAAAASSSTTIEATISSGDTFGSSGTNDFESKEREEVDSVGDVLMVSATTSTNVLAVLLKRVLIFLGELSNNNVILPVDVADLLRMIAQNASTTAAAAASSSSSKRAATLRRRADFYIHLVLCVLARVGSSLSTSSPTSFNELFQSLHEYFESRDVDAGAWNLTAAKHNGSVRCGLASQWDDICAMQEAAWASDMLLRPSSLLYNILGAATLHEISTTSLNLPSLDEDVGDYRRLTPEPVEEGLFGHFRGASGRNAASAQDVHLLQHYDILLFEDMIHDTLFLFSSSWDVCTKHLQKLPFAPSLQGEAASACWPDLDACIVDCLLRSLFRMPHPTHLIPYINAVLAAMCHIRTKSLLPRHFGQAMVQHFYRKLETYDVVVVDRIVLSTAHHISNIGDYKWAWVQFEDVIDEDDGDVQKRYVVDLLDACLRLSSETHIRKKLDVAPVLLALLTPHDMISINGDMVNVIVDLIRSNVGIDKVRAQLVVVGANASARLAILMEAILRAGCLTFTHFTVFLDRMKDAVNELVNEADEEQTVEDKRQLLLQTSLDVAANDGALRRLVLHRLLHEEIVTPVDVIKVLFNEKYAKSVKSVFWRDALRYALEFAQRRPLRQRAAAMHLLPSPSSAENVVIQEETVTKTTATETTTAANASSSLSTYKSMMNTANNSADEFHKTLKMLLERLIVRIDEEDADVNFFWSIFVYAMCRFSGEIALRGRVLEELDVADVSERVVEVFQQAKMFAEF